MIKTFTKIAAKAALKWSIVFGAGIIFSVVFLVVAWIQNSGLGDGFFSLIKALLLNNTAAFFLIFGSPVFMALYFVIANKVALQTAIHGIWKNKAEDFVTNRVKAIVNGITSRSDWANKISDGAMLRMRLLEANSNDPESSGLKKRVLKFGFKQIKLNDINLKDENVRLSDVIANRMSAFISEASEPSYLFFWILLGLQLVLLVISQFYTP